MHPDKRRAGRRIRKTRRVLARAAAGIAGTAAAFAEFARALEFSTRQMAESYDHAFASNTPEERPHD